MTERVGIMAAGNIVRDQNKRLERFPEKNGLVRCVEMHACAGGGAANVGLTLAALAPEMPVEVLCRLGADAAGDELLACLKSAPNIDTGHVIRGGQTAFADVLTEQGSDTRSFVYFPGENARLDIDDFFLRPVKSRIVHIGYILALDALDTSDAGFGTRMARLLRNLRAEGIETSVDVVSEASDRYRDKVPPCLPYADHLFLNEIEAGRTVGMDLRTENGAIDLNAVEGSLRALVRMGAAGKVMIHMPEGAMGIDARTGETAFVPAAVLPDGFIAATVGAGDAFAAGALIGAHQGKDLRGMLEDGAAAATACLQSETPVAQMTIGQARSLYSGLPKLNIK